MIEKFTGIRVSESLIRSVTEETGEKVFKEDMKRAKESSMRSPRKRLLRYWRDIEKKGTYIYSRMGHR